NRRCPRVAVMPRQERMRHLLSRLLPGLVEHVSLFPREFRRPIRICNIGKTNELLRIVPAVILRVCAGATGVLPLGLVGYRTLLTFFSMHPNADRDSFVS